MRKNNHNVVELNKEIATSASLTTTIDAILKPSSWDEHLAHWISQLGSPPVMGVLALFLIASSTALPAIWKWCGLYLFIAMLLPLSFLIWQVRRGHVTDLDIQLREQRKGAFLVTIAAFTLTWLVMLIGKAPPLLTFMAGVGVLQWLITFAITLHWKISVHSASATGVTMIILHVFGSPTAVPLMISLPLIAWSRVKLRRHTLSQTIAGMALGITVFLIALIISPRF